MLVASGDTQLALMELSNCENCLEAIQYFKNNIDVLKGWRYVYALEDNIEPFIIDNRQVVSGTSSAMVTSAFHGKSLWFIDERSVNPEAKILYKVGKGIYLDSNVASYVYSLAYKNIVPSQLSAVELLKLDYANFNPALYVWETLRHDDITSDTFDICKKTIAAIEGLSLINQPLNEEWGRIYQQKYQDQAEAAITPYFKQMVDYFDQGLRQELHFQTGLLEALLLKTKILEHSPGNSVKDKFEQLIRFMDETLSMMLVRELAVCADILYHENQSTMSQKLHSLENQKYPLARIKNCTWDLSIFRIMDMLSNLNIPNKPDYYIAEVLTCDKDIWGIYNLSALKGMAIHIDSSQSKLFLKNGMTSWLPERLGSNRMANLENIFSYDASYQRSTKPQLDIDALLQELRQELLTLLKR